MTCSQLAEGFVPVMGYLGDVLGARAAPANLGAWSVEDGTTAHPPAQCLTGFYFLFY